MVIFGQRSLKGSDRPYHALGTHRSALSTHSLPPQPPLLQLGCQTRALISLRLRRSARANGLSLDSFHNSPHPSISPLPSLPHPMRVGALYRPSPMPPVASTTPILSRPLAQRASSFALSTSPALVGLAPSWANRIGWSRRIQLTQPVRPPLFLFIYLLCLSFPSSQCHRFV